jgi:hypothetical protein
MSDWLLDQLQWYHIVLPGQYFARLQTLARQEEIERLVSNSHHLDPQRF